jgi:Flp pilus assembly pilin Flp
MELIIFFYGGVVMFSLSHLPRGQGLAEYALIIASVAIVVIVALALFGQQVGGLYSKVITSL